LELRVVVGRGDVSNPQQNRRYEHMHLTLKKETTKPPAKNFLQQQAKFDCFIECYNQERPAPSAAHEVPS